jgi:hypothetical protein
VENEETRRDIKGQRRERWWYLGTYVPVTPRARELRTRFFVKENMFGRVLVGGMIGEEHQTMCAIDRCIDVCFPVSTLLPRHSGGRAWME